MLGLLLGIILIPIMLIVFYHAERTLRDMMRNSSQLPTDAHTIMPVTIVKPVYGADNYTTRIFSRRAFWGNNEG